MRSWKSRLGRSAFVAMTAAALGFGAVAVVAPVREAQAQAQACNTGQCNGDCRASGGQYGFCDSVGCVCVM